MSLLILLLLLLIEAHFSNSITGIARNMAIGDKKEGTFDKSVYFSLLRTFVFSFTQRIRRAFTPESFCLSHTTAVSLLVLSDFFAAKQIDARSSAQRGVEPPRGIPGGMDSWRGGGLPPL